MTRNLPLQMALSLNGFRIELHLSYRTNYYIQFHLNYFKPHKNIENSPTHFTNKHFNHQNS